MCPLAKVMRRELELIETLWNVNYSEEEISRIPSIRINRNIVECK